MDELDIRKDCLYNPAERSKVNGTTHALAFLYVSMQALYVVSNYVHRWHELIRSTLLFSALGLIFPIAIEESRRRSRRKRAFGVTLKPHLEAKYAMDFSRSFHVGVSPGKKAKETFGSDCSWDVGYLVFNQELYYYGDQAGFRVARSQIRALKIVNRFYEPRLLVEFSDPRVDVPRHLLLEVRDRERNYEKLARLRMIKCEIELLTSDSEPLEVGLPLSGVEREYRILARTTT